MTKRIDPLVSVILPTYNRPQFARDAVESVLDQSYRKIELIIIDDGSSVGNTFEVSDPDDRMSVFINDKNRGVSYSRNRGIQEATGKYIAFIDDDDRWHQEKLRKQVDVLESSPDEYCGVYTGARCVKENEIIGTVNQPIDGDIHPKILVRFFAYPTSSFLLLRETIEAVGGFDENIDRGEDWDLTIRLSKRYKFASIDKPLIDIGFHNNKVSENSEHAVISRENIWRKHESEFNRYSLIKREFLHIWRRQKSVLELSSGNRSNALRNLMGNLSHPTIMDIGLLLLVPFGRTGYRIANQSRK